MLKNTKTFSLKRQKRALLVLEWCSGFRPAGSVWVLLLALRGFSLVEIGAAEGVFHIVSLCCELPSGLLADLLGRKRTLTVSQAMFLLSALLMTLSRDMGGVCLALAASALGEILRLSRWNPAAGGLIFGGGASNLWENFRHGRAYDYLEFPKVPRLNRYVCNLADVAILFGGIGIIVGAARRGRRK